MSGNENFIHFSLLLFKVFIFSDYYLKPDNKMLEFLLAVGSSEGASGLEFKGEIEVDERYLLDSPTDWRV